MIRSITIFTVAIAFIGLGGGFLFGAANLIEPFPEFVAAGGVSAIYRDVSAKGGADFEVLRLVTGTMGIELLLRGLLGIVCLFYGHSGRNLYWQISFVAGILHGYWQYTSIFKNPALRNVYSDNDTWGLFLTDAFLAVFGLLLGVLFRENPPKYKTK